MKGLNKGQKYHGPLSSHRTRPSRETTRGDRTTYPETPLHTLSGDEGRTETGLVSWQGVGGSPVYYPEHRSGLPRHYYLLPLS